MPALRLGRLCSLLERRCRQAVNLGRVHARGRKRLGRVQDVVGELGAQFAELLGDLVVPVLLGAVEGDAAELGVANLALHRPSLRIRERRPRGFVFRESHEGVVHGTRLTDSKGRGDDGGLALVVRRAQGFAVSDALQVGDDPPRPAELLGQSLERIHEIGPFFWGGLRKRGLDRVDLRVDLVHRGHDRGLHVLGGDGRPLREVGGFARGLPAEGPGREGILRQGRGRHGDRNGRSGRGADPGGLGAAAEGGDGGGAEGDDTHGLDDRAQGHYSSVSDADARRE